MRRLPALFQSVPFLQHAPRPHRQLRGAVAKLTPEDHHRVVDECYYCKLCFNHCPYTPPHQYDLDFPLLMVLWKKRLAAERGVRWRDRLLIMTDLIGQLGSLTAP